MTRRTLLMAGSLAPVLRFGAAAPTPPLDYPATAVPLTQVEIRDEFWAPRIEANRAVSIWHCFERLNSEDDFNLSKLIEGAAYILAKRPDPKLQAYTEERIARLLATMLATSPARLEPRLRYADAVPLKLLNVAVTPAELTNVTL